MSRKSHKNEDKRESRLSQDQMDEVYLSGIKRFHERGIPIVIDGKRASEEEWSRILEVREDQSFYMADFVASEQTGKLQEIRFDRVYHQ